MEGKGKCYTLHGLFLNLAKRVFRGVRAGYPTKALAVRFNAWIFLFRFSKQV